jgi:hypothetical protein
MPTAEVIDRYLELPPHSKPRSSSVTPRKLLTTNTGGSTVVRSSNPKGYLIPDIGSFVFNSVHDGTVRPDTTTIVIGDAAIVVQISAAEEIAEHVFPALLGGRLGSVVMTHPSQDHLTGLGLHGLLGSYGALSGVLAGAPAPVQRVDSPPLIVDLLEDAPALVIGGARKTVVNAPVESTTRVGADASVAEIASRIAELSGLTDGELARVFRVARETFQRWRTGELANPNPANRRRLGLLNRLLEDLEQRDVKVDQWLRNVSEIEDLTPYDLLERGRLDDVEFLAAHVQPRSQPKGDTAPDGSPVTRASGYPVFVPRREEPVTDLIAEDDEGWDEVETEPADDDD